MKHMSVHELKSKLNSPGVVLIDVREPHEHQAEWIEGAIPMPLSTLSAEQIPKTAIVIIFHCAGGVRSQTDCEKVMNHIDNIEFFSLDGGIQAWKAAGFETQTGK